MTELERRALLGDKQAQEECTDKGIVLPCPFCGSKAERGVNKKIQQLIADTPTIDPETLPIVQRLRTQLDAIKEAYSVAGHRPLLTQAIERFGQESQERMMFEEMSELQKAMCKLSRGKGCIDDIAQEIADVEIMLEQMKILYQCEESAALWKHEKLERLRSLLNKGRDE